MDDKPYVFQAMLQAREQAKRDIHEDSEIAKRWIAERGSVARHNTVATQKKQPALIDEEELQVLEFLEGSPVVKSLIESGLISYQLTPLGFHAIRPKAK